LDIRLFIINLPVDVLVVVAVDVVLGVVDDVVVLVVVVGGGGGGVMLFPPDIGSIATKQNNINNDFMNLAVQPATNVPV